MSYTKEKQREYAKCHYEKNKEKRLSQCHEYYRKNKKNILEKQKKYYQIHSESIKQREKKHRRDNKKSVAERKRKYYLKNREHISGMTMQYRIKNNEKYKKYQKGYFKSEKGMACIAKSYAKRKRNLGWTKLFENVFEQSVKIEWHHVSDEFVVAMPKYIHQLYYGYKNHRELCMNVINQIYMGGR